MMTGSPAPTKRQPNSFLPNCERASRRNHCPTNTASRRGALTSLWEVFDQARDGIKNNPGCEQFAEKTTHVLNIIVRPLTAKWDRAFEEGRLNGRDGADEFRDELQDVLEELRKSASSLTSQSPTAARRRNISARNLE